jgi:hypothetical protein
MGRSPRNCNTMSRRRRLLIFGMIAVLGILGTGILVAPWVLRESETIRDRRIRLDGEEARVLVVRSSYRSLLEYPHGSLIGGGGLRYDTTIEYLSGRVLRVRTEIQPRTVWSSGGRVFVVCNDGGLWLTGEIKAGQVIEIPRASLPEAPPSWNLQPPEQKAEWDQSFAMWAR